MNFAYEESVQEHFHSFKYSIYALSLIMKIENRYVKLWALIQLGHLLWSVEQCGFW